MAGGQWKKHGNCSQASTTGLTCPVSVGNVWSMAQRMRESKGRRLKEGSKEVWPNDHIASTTGFISHLPVGMNAAWDKQ